MPSYDYTCPCGHEIETFEPMTAPAVQPCPVCREQDCANDMTRRIGKGGAILWKGGPPTRRFGR